ncbi:type II toxin-antitoxin system RelE/ParE family toxin [Changpingibacter yushuensis]|uniref:type II toxin-antitoxin system RelE/ParE family toxin n=1 Tax=Changpingibacter yushuensis TaxID=2758440 RepID=UPI001FE33DB6|nr:type II toxin-antitoxin system RelE/ParE family toxin [Changpingibacter yushuensis]
MRRKLGDQRAKALRLRLNELSLATEIDELLCFPGKWEALTGDRIGQWSGRLTANWRLIVAPEDGNVVVWIVEIGDYH